MTSQAIHMRGTFSDCSKALVLFSGGLDSSTLLALAVDELGASNVLALGIFYGQRHVRELESAKAVAAHYGTELLQADLTTIFMSSDSSLLAHSERQIPKSSYVEQLEVNRGGLVSSYVPFRNGLFLSAAASIALSKGCDAVAYGAHRDDAAGDAYPDCSSEFVEHMAAAIARGTGEELLLKAPFVGLAKADIVALGLELGVPYELTWSCYEGGEVPCGCCATCIDRAAAFEAHNAADPLLRKRP